ncbi:MAG: hypothetical protein HXX09_04935 [Bacteroidetes bacterium]|nr:hypothetical protein [Bacteroidota bacterium]
MKKCFLIIASIILLPLVSYCNNIGEDAMIQRDTTKHLKKNIIYAEFLGNGFPASINYERMFSFKSMKKSQFSIRVGIGSNPLNWSHPYIFPVMINYIYGKRSVKFYCGLGFNLPKGSWFGDGDYYNGTASLGVRFVHQNKISITRPSFYFNFGMTPIIGIPTSRYGYYSKPKFFPMLGLGIGIAF